MMQIEISEKEAAMLADNSVEVGRMVGAAELGLMTVGEIANRARFDLSPMKPTLDAAQDLLSRAKEKQKTVVGTLHRCGIKPGASQPQTRGNDLAMLSTIGSDDSCELLDLLEKAQAVAERIDASRGFVVDEKIPLQPGESRGTDLAESLSMLALRVRREATGGQSRHE